MNPRISFGIIVLNGYPFLEYNLDALYEFAYQIIVIEGATKAAKSLAREDGHSKDGTFEKLKEYKEQKDPDDKLLIVSAQDEGFTNGFWPEKLEMSQAYARRAMGDWLWQVDSDEFYRIGDMHTVVDLLTIHPELSGISFPFFEFWGGFDYVITGKWYIQEFREVARVFRWGPGYEYANHRPPTVVDEGGQPPSLAYRLSGAHMKARGIYMYHYSYVLPKQALQKVGYYSNVAWSDAFRHNQTWWEEAYQQLKHPLFLGERGRPILQWLERFGGEHPSAIRQLRADLESGYIHEELRATRDLERLLRSPWYWLATRLLRLLMTPYWRIRLALRRRKAR